MHTSIRFKARVEEVHSGDDLVLLVDLGIDSLYKRIRARLHGVDTPDAYKAVQGTEAGKVRDTVREITNNKACYVEVKSEGKGGWVVRLFVENDNEPMIDVNQSLIDSGYVFSKSGGRDSGGAKAKS